ncbi:nitroreductase family protein [Brevifollis gellanilyticus]|nr:nitroreductase [Brevifollis gellanilyticus]
MLPSHSQLSALLRHRRSIKPVDLDHSRDVDRSLLSQILEDATWAPSHGMTEPWKFHLFTAESRQQLAAQMQEAYRESTPPAEFREDKLRKMGENPLLAPVVIACVMERNGGTKIPEIEEIEAVACALQNLQLSATAAGLGCYWSSGLVLDAPGFRTWLGIRAEDRCVGLIYLGWPRPDLNWPRSVRKPVDTKMVWH